MDGIRRLKTEIIKFVSDTVDETHPFFFASLNHRTVVRAVTAG
jgi:hypothetical protein